MDLINHLNHIRKQRKCSIKSLAKPLNLSETQVYNLLSGKSRMNTEQLVIICSEIGVNIEFCYEKSK